jgi:hypothetical protein
MNIAASGRRLICVGLCAILSTNASSRAAGHEFVLLSFHDPVPGHESEFETSWPAFLHSAAAVPGVIRTEDFRRANIRLRDGAQPLPAHLAFFTISAADPAAVVQSIERISISAADDATLSRNLSYRREGIWKHRSPSNAGDVFLQIVLSNPAPGKDAEYRRWYQQNHGPELATVPGNYEIEFGSSTDKVVSNAARTAPTYLSAMRFKTAAILAFKENLERESGRLTKSISYDIEGSWRETYQLITIDGNQK